MAQELSRSAPAGLERSCAELLGAAQPHPEQPGDWFRSREPESGVELLEAWFAGHAYDKHRHETYAIGVTESGVQSFDYRGATINSTPGKVVVVHPDETHDGHAGTDDGFGYRILYVDPWRISEALRAVTDRPRPLPFVREAASDNPKLANAVRAAFTHELEPLAVDSLILQLAEGLVAGDPSWTDGGAKRIFHVPALERARDFLAAEKHRVVHSSELEAVTGLTRYELARQFRALFGTSPYRFLLTQRVRDARREIRRGQSLAELALDAGFADQAHFTRVFKSAYGITPARFAALEAHDVPRKLGG